MTELTKQWSDLEMEQFDREIEPYRVEVLNPKTNKSFRYFSVGSELKYLEDRKIIRVKWLKNWQQIRGAGDVEFSIRNKKIYQDFEDKMNFYFDWKENKKLASLGICKEE